MTRRLSVVMTEGNHTFVQDWAKCASTVADVLLLSAGLTPAAMPVDPSGVRRATTSALRLRPSRAFQRVNAVLGSRAIRDATQRGQPAAPDLLHSHFYAGAGAVARFAKRNALPFVHTEHSSSILNGSISRSGRETLLSVCRDAAAVTAVSADLRDAMHELGVRREILVIPNPVDTGRFRTPRRTSASAGPTAPRFVSIGFLNEGKDHASLILAFSMVREVLPTSTLTIIGDGKQRAALDALIGRLGLAGAVELAGRLSRSQVAEVLASSDVYVHSSRLETFGVALVEAWASGLPVVAFDCGGVSRLAEQFAGRVARPRDVASLASAMTEVAGCLDTFDGQRVSDQCEATFGLAATEHRIASVYLSLVPSR